VIGALSRCVPKVPHAPLPPLAQLASGIAIAGTYLRLLVFPVGLCLHYHFAQLDSLLHPDALLGIALGAAMLAGGVVAFRRSKIALFALGWIAIALAPLCVLLLVGRPVADPRAYVPSVGLCILIALASVRRTPRRGADTRPHTVGMIACSIVVAVYASLTVARTLDWTDEFAIWSDTAAKNPHSWHARRYLGAIHLHAGEPAKALELLREAITLHPTGDYTALHQAAQLCEEMGRLDEAIKYRGKLVELDPGNADERVSLGMLYAATGAPTQAMWQLTAALSLHPTHADAHYNLGVLHANSGDYGRAIRHLEQAASLASDRPLVHRALAVAYESVERYDLALAAYQKCLALQRGAADAWLGAGRCHEKLERRDAAAHCYRRCIELGGPAAEEARRRLRALTDGPSRVLR